MLCANVPWIGRARSRAAWLAAPTQTLSLQAACNQINNDFGYFEGDDDWARGPYFMYGPNGLDVEGYGKGAVAAGGGVAARRAHAGIGAVVLRDISVAVPQTPRLPSGAHGPETTAVVQHLSDMFLHMRNSTFTAYSTDDNVCVYMLLSETYRCFQGGTACCASHAQASLSRCAGVLRPRRPGARLDPQHPA